MGLKKHMIPLVKNTIDNSDIDRLIDWLKTYPRLTKGKVTLELEKKWSACQTKEFPMTDSTKETEHARSPVKIARLSRLLGHASAR